MLRSQLPCLTHANLCETTSVSGLETQHHWQDARAVLPYSTCDMLCPTNVPTSCRDGRCIVDEAMKKVDTNLDVSSSDASSRG